MELLKHWHRNWVLMVILAERSRSVVYYCGMAKPAQNGRRVLEFGKTLWAQNGRVERRICGMSYRPLADRKKKQLI